jgi:hypothetical protein
LCYNYLRENPSIEKEGQIMDFKKFMAGALELPEEGDRVEYFKLKQRVSGNVLTNAQRETVGAGYFYEADITKFWEEFKKLQSEVDYKLSFNTVMMRAMVEGLKAAPRLNAHMKYNHTSSSGKLIVKKHVDVAMPYIFETGEKYVTVREIDATKVCQVKVYLGGNKTMKNNCVHAYSKVDVLEPTHETGGYTLNECSKCNHTYYSAYTNPVHDYSGKVVEVIAPTATKFGLSKHYCTQCDKYEVRDNQLVAE